MKRVGHLQGLRKWTAILALFALMLSAVTPMSGMLYSGTSSDICGQGASNGTVPSNGAVPAAHHCDLCLLQCHLGWLPPAPEHVASLLRPEITRIGLDRSVETVTALRAFSPIIPRGPPVVA